MSNVTQNLPSYPRLSYATVRDYCDSYDRFQKLSTHQNDLKDAQRPWTVKAILANLPAPARLLEVGSGEPLAASALADLGYEVHVCDPFDGSGRGPTEYLYFRSVYRNVEYIRSYFNPEIAQQFVAKPLDCVFSISVLEHVKDADLLSLFDAINIALRPGGFSIHCMDIVIDGPGVPFHTEQLIKVLTYHALLAGPNPDPAAIQAEAHQIIDAAKADLETFFLSPHGHNQWRGATPYNDFPFRKVISVQTIIKKA